MRSVVAGIVVAASTGLLTVPAFGASAGQKVVPVSCGAMPRQDSFSPTQAPAINYRAVAPLGYGTVSGDLSITFTEYGQVVRAAQRLYSGQSPAVYKFAPLPSGRYTVNILLQTPRHSTFRSCSTMTRLVVAPRPAPSISPLPEPLVRPPHGR